MTNADFCPLCNNKTTDLGWSGSPHCLSCGWELVNDNPKRMDEHEIVPVLLAEIRRLQDLYHDISGAKQHYHDKCALAHDMLREQEKDIALIKETLIINGIAVDDRGRCRWVWFDDCKTDCGHTSSGWRDDWKHCPYCGREIEVTK